MAEQWEERKGGTFWEPEREGAELVGKLQIRNSTYGPVYDITQANGEVLTVRRSAFLENRITETDNGKEVKIVYTGEQDSGKGKNPMRTYQVFFKK